MNTLIGITLLALIASTSAVPTRMIPDRNERHQYVCRWDERRHQCTLGHRDDFGHHHGHVVGPKTPPRTERPEHEPRWPRDTRGLLEIDEEPRVIIELGVEQEASVGQIGSRGVYGGN